MLNLLHKNFGSIPDVPAPGPDELFEMVRLKRTEQAYDIRLDEKKKLSDEDYLGERGYMDYVTIQDYPMREIGLTPYLGSPSGAALFIIIE
ncbi:MAG: hypothetical protein K2I69_09670 [Muribaculaceae bacterium]|nr:hypothetical protein [Muribaculaceae bacterium]